MSKQNDDYCVETKWRLLYLSIGDTQRLLKVGSAFRLATEGGERHERSMMMMMALELHCTIFLAIRSLYLNTYLCLKRGNARSTAFKCTEFLDGYICVDSPPKGKTASNRHITLSGNIERSIYSPAQLARFDRQSCVF